VDLWRDEGPAHGENGTEYEEVLFSNNTMRIISEHDPTEPLFLFHSFHLIHTPLEVPEAYEQRFSFLKDKSRRLYAAMVQYMDEELGTFVSALQEKGMWEDTLMIVSSDNGGPIYSGPITKGVDGGANNIPLKGGKLTDWEGGIRVNAFVSGGVVPVGKRGTELDKYVHISDWYATLCHMAGVEAADERAAKVGLPAVDSIDQWDLLFGNTSFDSATAPRTSMHISKAAYIEGNFKIIIGNVLPSTWGGGLFKAGQVPFAGYFPGYGLQGAIDTVIKREDCGTGCLYDIMNDPNEYHDLAKDQPDLLKKMFDTLSKLNEKVFEPDRGTMTTQACDTALQQYKGFYGPFVKDS